LGDTVDPHKLNLKGCSAAHWAASGGDLAVCRLLAEDYEVDFSVPNLEVMSINKYIYISISV